MMLLKILFLIWSLCQIAAAARDRSFPPGFRFGAASAAYQVEGAWNHSDKGESIWDRLAHSTSLIQDGATGDVACNSHALWRSDIQLAKDLGLHFYRFSISWPRLLPTGFANKVSSDGALYYNQLIDGLLAEGIDPVVTLYHWDLPQALQDLGGWTNPEIVTWFADYARVAFTLFADRVEMWQTINEGVIVCDLAYTSGKMAPGVRDDEVGPHLCTKHVLLAHAAAWRIYDEEFRPKYHGKVSLANQAFWYEPLTNSTEDVEAAELAMQFGLGRYSEAIFGEGGWPPAVEKLIDGNSKAEGYPRSRLPKFTEEEKAFVKGTFDYYGLNHYTSRAVKAAGPSEMNHAGWGGYPMTEWKELPVKFSARDWPSGCNGWLRVYPEGFRKLLVWIKKTYGDVPILVTENGFPLCKSGLEDPERISYYEQYLEALLRAVKEDGVNVTGYTAWTLLDNFEWLNGYNTKFGLHEVDFNDPSRPRTPRRSARYYANIIRHHSLDIPDKSEL